ncbi:ThuA domain-containing protein [Legionella gresilensis]|uniref:ThuA domain-containing protein n=1 Tax=Legionella gresilensis TaxID=91823 RepID=UPI00104102BD|nr:ThuA domain-containing protein [Legionella gresilensis]
MTSSLKRLIKVLVWSEGTEPKEVYPIGINGHIASFLTEKADIDSHAISFNDDSFGIKKDTLKQADVLIWFGHKKHHELPDEIANQITEAIEHGMGFIALHSSHFSKPFKKILKASGQWQSYKDTGEPEHIEILLPHHPIAAGISNFTIPQTEIYEEPFEVPTPAEVIMQGKWNNNLISREVLTWQINQGKVVYIRAGHEDYPIYFMPQMQKLIVNAVYWTVSFNH